jgi:hypothetical protein
MELYIRQAISNRIDKRKRFKVTENRAIRFELSQPLTLDLYPNRNPRKTDSIVTAAKAEATSERRTDFLAIPPRLLRKASIAKLALLLWL